MIACYFGSLIANLVLDIKSNTRADFERLNWYKMGVKKEIYARWIISSIKLLKKIYIYILETCLIPNNVYNIYINL